MWYKQRDTPTYLLFSFSAAAAAAISGFELRMNTGGTVEQYQLLLRWIHLPTFVLTVSFVARRVVLVAGVFFGTSQSIVSGINAI